MFTVITPYKFVEFEDYHRNKKNNANKCKLYPIPVYDDDKKYILFDYANQVNFPCEGKCGVPRGSVICIGMSTIRYIYIYDNDKWNYGGQYEYINTINKDILMLNDGFIWKNCTFYGMLNKYLTDEKQLFIHEIYSCIFYTTVVDFYVAGYKFRGMIMTTTKTKHSTKHTFSKAAIFDFLTTETVKLTYSVDNAINIKLDDRYYIKAIDKLRTRNLEIFYDIFSTDIAEVISSYLY